MAVIETWIKTDLKSIVKVTPIHGILFTQDNMANLIGVELLEGGQPATVTGSVSANVLRADGTTVAVAGTLSGNKASVTLPQAAYAVPGMLAVVIKLTDSSTVTTIGAIQAIVYRASTDTIIDPGTIIPSVQDLIAAIDAAVDSIPPDYSALTAEVGDLKNAMIKKVGWKEVNEMNTTFFTIGSNRYNKDTATDGVMINQTDPETHSDSSFTTSDYIYVGDLSTIKFMRLNAAGTAYITDSAYYMLFDADLNKLANRNVANSVDVSSAVWIKVSNSLQHKSTFMVLDNATTVTAYIPYSFTFNYLTNDAANKVDKNGIGQVDELNTTFFSIGVNKLNLATIADNTQLNQSSDGTHEQTGLCTSDYIDVSDLDSISFYRKNKAGTAMISESAYYILYNASKVMTATRALASTVNVSSASYIRISLSMADKSSYMVCDSDYYVSDYVPYGYVFDYAEEEKVTTIRPSDHVLAKLIANQGKDIYFADGNYDIIAIYKDYYGNDFFDNYTGYGSDALCRGLPVYQGTTMRFSPNARFTAQYTGNNTYVKMHFSAFAFEGGVTFDGLNIVASGIRNIIHDDFDNNYVGRTTIKNCHFKHDYIIIAGGLALHEIVEIVNNYFERTDTTTHVFDFSYHNNGTTGAQSEMIIKDNYCSKGISIRYYGSSNLDTDCMISNNSMANDIEYRAENETATIQNMRVLKWNNEIRSI